MSSRACNVCPLLCTASLGYCDDMQTLQAEAHAMIKAADKNNDGEIDLDEFLALMRPYTDA